MDSEFTKKAEAATVGEKPQVLGVVALGVGKDGTLNGGSSLPSCFCIHAITPHHLHSPPLSAPPSTGLTIQLTIFLRRNSTSQPFLRKSQS